MRSIDWALAAALAAETLPIWAPRLLGRHVVSFKPGEVRWWPNRYDCVHIFAGPPPTAIGEWSARWRRSDRWGRDLIQLVAAMRGCRPGQAAAYVARAAGAPFDALLIDRQRAGV